MSEDKLSIQVSAPPPVEARPAADRVRPEKIEKAVPVEKPVVDSKPVRSPKIDPVEDINRIEKIGDRGLAIAAESFSIDRIREKVAELEAALPKASNSLVFSVDEVLNRPVITVVDKKSGEVVRTLPSDEVIRAVHNIDRMKGILFEDLF
jgi:uncharacterized FlaG/YvyC family protein